MEDQQPTKNQTFPMVHSGKQFPTWDNLQRRNLHGPGWCILCKGEEESVLHLFLKYAFIKAVWAECVRTLRAPYVWEWESILQALTNWRTREDSMLMEAFPLFIL